MFDRKNWLATDGGCIRVLQNTYWKTYVSYNGHQYCINLVLSVTLIFIYARYLKDGWLGC